MKQNFELDLEKSRLFMKYLNAAMRDPKIGMLQANGSGQFIDNQYVVEQSVNFVYNEKPIFVVWKIIFENDVLISIENTNQVNDDGTYEKTLLQFLNRVLQKTLSQQKEKFFIRQIYLAISGNNLNGEYWLPGFRLAPLFPDDTSTIISNERAIVFDQEVHAIDLENAKEVGISNAARYSAHMSFILNTGFYLPMHMGKYFLQKNENTLSMVRKSTQFIDQTGVREMPKKGDLCKHVKFQGNISNPFKFINERLTCPIETRKILRGIAESHENIRNAFDGCCYLFQLALNAGRYYPTVKISYLCGAVEAIVKSNKSEYNSFSDFMKRYAGENSELYNFIYDVRSSHWHSGQFMMGDHIYYFRFK